MIENIENERQQIKVEIDAVCKVDAGLNEIVQRVGYPEPRVRDASFRTLAQIITAQLLSTKAVAAIWSRVEQTCNGVVTPQVVSELSPATLNACGLSKRKGEYIQSLAQKILTNEVELTCMRTLSEEDVVKTLTQLKGVGEWSAEIFAMFALHKRDIFPSKDLALQVAVGNYLKLDTRPCDRQVKMISKRWAPYRSAVALLMWKYYGSTALEMC